MAEAWSMPRLCWSVQSGYTEFSQLALGSPLWAEAQLLKAEKCKPKRMNPSLTCTLFGIKGQFLQRWWELPALLLLLHPKEMKGKSLAKIMAEQGPSFCRKFWSLLLAERGLLQSYVNRDTKAASAQSAGK